MQRWKPSGARLNARPWKEANNGPRIGFDGSYSNSSKRLITGAGSTALWGINHLWTSNKTTTKNGKDRVKYCDHKKGGRENIEIRDSSRCLLQRDEILELAMPRELNLESLPRL